MNVPYIKLQTARASVPYRYDPAFPARHGFSTREGGVSRLPHLASLNLGYDRGEDAGLVDENRTRLIRAVCGEGFDRTTAVSAVQIHSVRIETVTEADRGRSDFSCDGFVTDRSGVPLLIKTADCLPILFCDDTSGIIGAVHSGWRGTAAGIAPQAVSAMERLGSRREDISVLIGPCIHSCCFTIGEDFIDSVGKLLPKEVFSQTLFRDDAGTWHADLCKMTVLLLLSAGILPDRIRAAEDCTCCRPELFFSHRATGGKRGLSGAVIMLP